MRRFGEGTAIAWLFCHGMAHVVSVVLLATLGICRGSDCGRHRLDHGNPTALAPPDKADLTLEIRAKEYPLSREARGISPQG